AFLVLFMFESPLFLLLSIFFYRPRVLRPRAYGECSLQEGGIPEVSGQLLRRRIRNNIANEIRKPARGRRTDWEGTYG
ncbi:MAG TPA: hypothetical protein DEB40_00935, partial [Elusimicrobia bacterium]|nr:hypothetical protein [Elusimicrobiota bacterium]